MAEEKNDSAIKTDISATTEVPKQEVDNSTKIDVNASDIDIEKSRFPFCLVWTPTPFLSWILPFIGHIGIGTSTGIIRDFPFPYRVREDRMAFGKPTVYVQLSKEKAFNGDGGWDGAVTEASHMFKKKMHFVIFQNCHSHVSKALNLMQYDGQTDWNGFKLLKLRLTEGKYVNRTATIKTWLPFVILIVIIIIIIATCSGSSNAA